MQLYISHKLPRELELPIHYHHIVQSIIYHNLEEDYGYSGFLHQEGYSSDERSFRLFVFSLLKGKYEIRDKKIIFRNEISFQVRSADVRMLRILMYNLSNRGISYLNQHYDNISLHLEDKVISEDCIHIKMLSPLSVNSTDPETKKTCFYHPQEEEFGELVKANFLHKYKAYSGIEPLSDIHIRPIKVTSRDKYVTSYKNFFLSGWFGEYELFGEPKYLDFLYQVWLGSRNSQGFGMFEIMK